MFLQKRHLWLLAIWLVAVFASRDLSAQQLQPQGSHQSWQHPAETQLDNSIRSQIGLANWEEPAGYSQPQNESTESETASSLIPDDFSKLISGDGFTSREGIGGTIKTVLLIGILSLAPAIVLMTTSYVRVIVVLTLLKQAFGSQQLPPNQVLTALSLFITLLVMMPVWNQVKTEAIDPYAQSPDGISWEVALDRGIVPVKSFMVNQIMAAKNDEAIALFYRYLPPDHPTAQALYQGSSPTMAKPKITLEQIKQAPLSVLLPAFVISELKVAFLLGFQIYLPFLVIDLVVSAVTVSSGMLMLPPTMVSFPLKLFMFVLVDGWNLVVGMLLQSFQTVM